MAAAKLRAFDRLNPALNRAPLRENFSTQAVCDHEASTSRNFSSTIPGSDFETFRNSESLPLRFAAGDQAPPALVHIWTHSKVAESFSFYWNEFLF